MLIAFSGLPGTGKSTIARVLARALPAVHVRIDSIEQALRAKGLDVVDEGYRVAYAVAEDNLRLGHIVIADCVNPWPLTREAWHEVASRAGARCLDIEVVCSDLEEHRRRVESRAADISGFALPSWQEVLARDYRAWDTQPLVIDASRTSVDEAVACIRSQLR